MYRLLRRFLSPPLADAAIVGWYAGLLFLALYFASVDQARFAYSAF